MTHRGAQVGRLSRDELGVLLCVCRDQASVRIKELECEIDRIHRAYDKLLYASESHAYLCRSFGCEETNACDFCAAECCGAAYCKTHAAQYLHNVHRIKACSVTGSKFDHLHDPELTLNYNFCTDCTKRWFAGNEAFIIEEFPWK